MDCIYTNFVPLGSVIKIRVGVLVVVIAVVFVFNYYRIHIHAHCLHFLAKSDIQPLVLRLEKETVRNWPMYIMEDTASYALESSVQVNRLYL